MRRLKGCQKNLLEVRIINRDDTLLVQTLRTSPVSSGCVQELYVVVHYLLLGRIEQQSVKFFWDTLNPDAIYLSPSSIFLTSYFKKTQRIAEDYLVDCQKTHRYFILILFCGCYFFGEHWLRFHITIESVSTDSAKPTRFGNSRIMLNRVSQLHHDSVV